MKVLVTGGAGFVGSHLIERLLVQDHDVVCLDNFITGKLINLKPFENKITVIEGDISNIKDVQTSLEDVESVYHLAAQISVSQSVRNPLYDASININGFLNLLNAVLDTSVKRIVYVSTGGAIYGEPLQLPASETTLEAPISPYGLSKLVGDTYLKWYNTTHGLSYAIIRPANIFGPRQDPLGEAGVISIYLGRMLNQQPLEIFGDGSDTRDYIYVKDIATICTSAMASKTNKTFNAGTGDQTSLNDLVEIIGGVTGLPLKKEYKSPRPGDVKKIALDITRAKTVLNWIPKTSLTEGLHNTWNWFKEID